MLVNLILFVKVMVTICSKSCSLSLMRITMLRVMKMKMMTSGFEIKMKVTNLSPSLADSHCSAQISPVVEEGEDL